MNSETTSVSVGGRKFAVRSIGSGPASVMLVAGYGQSMSQAWSSVHQRLGESVRTCAYDRLGVGDSDPPSGTRTFVDLAEDLEGVITALGMARPLVLVAHSMGAPVAMTWAAQRPADVSAVVLLDGSGLAFHEAIGVAVAKALREGSEDPDVLAVKAFLDDFEDPQTNIERVDVVSSYAALDPFPHMGTVPVMVMHGTVTDFPSVMEPERLHAVWLAGQRAWASTSKQGRIIEVTGAGHQIALERPDLVVQTVLSLIQSADAELQHAPRRQDTELPLRTQSAEATGPLIASSTSSRALVTNYERPHLPHWVRAVAEIRASTAMAVSARL